MADTKYLDDPTARAKMVRAVAARDKGLIYSQIIKVVTRGLGGHRPARTMCVYALQQGLKVAHEHDGGWLVRNHVITVEGDPVKVVSFELICARRYQART